MVIKRKLILNLHPEKVYSQGLSRETLNDSYNMLTRAMTRLFEDLVRNNPRRVSMESDSNLVFSLERASDWCPKDYEHVHDSGTAPEGSIYNPHNRYLCI